MSSNKRLREDEESIAPNRWEFYIQIAKVLAMLGVAGAAGYGAWALSAHPIIQQLLVNCSSTIDSNVMFSSEASALAALRCHNKVALFRGACAAITSGVTYSATYLSGCSKRKKTEKNSVPLRSVAIGRRFDDEYKKHCSLDDMKFWGSDNERDDLAVAFYNFMPVDPTERNQACAVFRALYSNNLIWLAPSGIMLPPGQCRLVIGPGGTFLLHVHGVSVSSTLKSRDLYHVDPDVIVDRVRQAAQLCQLQIRNS